MEFEEADRLLDRITDFLLSCGGAYQQLTGELQQGIIFALVSGQYVLKETAGDINYFASFFKVNPDDVPAITARELPPVLSRGDFLYVAEMGNMAGRKGMTEMVAEIRNKAGEFIGVFWHRPVKQDKVYRYPRQRGKEV